MMRDFKLSGRWLVVVVAGLGWLSSLVELAAEELVVPAATAYFEPLSADHFKEGRVVVRWQEPGVKVMWHGYLRTPGVLQASLRIRPAAKAATFRLTIAEQSKEATLPVSKEPVATLEFGEFAIDRTGYQSFVLESLDPPKSECGEIESLVLSGPACEQAHFNLKPRRNAASVHLGYSPPRDFPVAWFYNEVTAIEDPIDTFYMACGFSRGYLGIQVNSPTERRIIFSVWDAGAGVSATDRSNVEAEDRVEVVAKGPETHTRVFGGEGTGGHSHIKYMWKTGEVQKLLVTAKPVDATHTIYTGYYFRPDTERWELIASFRAPKDGGYLRGLYSFSENFSGRTGHLRRKALFGNAWIRSQDGDWSELIDAAFTHDETGRHDRLDRFAGVEGQNFLLSHGGFVDGQSKLYEKFHREAQAEPPVINLPEDAVEN